MLYPIQPIYNIILTAIYIIVLLECHKILHPLSMRSINSLIKITKTPIQNPKSSYKILSQLLNREQEHPDIVTKTEYPQ